MDYYKIGQAIRRYRKARGMSQEQLAESAGIPVTHMSHIETGNTKLSLPVLVEISKALEVQTDQILFEHPTRSSKPLPGGAVYFGINVVRRLWRPISEAVFGECLPAAVHVGLKG